MQNGAGRAGLYSVGRLSDDTPFYLDTGKRHVHRLINAGSLTSRVAATLLGL